MSSLAGGIQLDRPQILRFNQGMNPYAIYTASDKKYGDFLIEHWLASLRATTDLRQIDVRVLDFGLSLAQRSYLEHEGVGVRRCRRDGHVTVVRFRELAEDLSALPYETVMACDGGDIIFQDDISPLFRQNPHVFRAVTEDLKSGFEFFLSEDFFSRSSLKEMKSLISAKPQINAGLILGPKSEFLELCRAIDTLIKDKSRFGPDQLVVNYILHKKGFIDLGSAYNFVIATAKENFEIIGGVFFSKTTGKPIPVVHNAGNWKFLRPVENFGFGPSCNHLKPDVMTTLRFLHHSTAFLQSSQEQVKKLARKALARTRELQKNVRLRSPKKTKR
ncbi:MAG: hypothetical protein HKM06_07935 [Spirochaetales bacterium]|nr:hypothetical protein [Spirochaetales bacterium]